MSAPVLPPLTAYLASRRALIDEALERYLPKSPACPAIIADAIRYSVMAGGKRLRPILTLAAAEAVMAVDRVPSSRERPGSSPAVVMALPAACALEFIHTYSLVHDDLPAMDNDTLRRGRPTVHVVYGEGLAILVGDGLLTEAFALLAREPPGDDMTTPARRVRVIEVVALAAGPAGMVGGQAIDLRAAGTAAAPDAVALQAMHRKKTGALIRAAAAAGAIMAGGSDELIGAIDRFAADLGLAFQIVDDILDVEGEAAQLGKTAGKDAASGKPTYPALYGLDESRRLVSETLARARATLAASGIADRRLIELAEWAGGRQS